MLHSYCVGAPSNKNSLLASDSAPDHAHIPHANKIIMLKSKDNIAEHHPVVKA